MGLENVEVAAVAGGLQGEAFGEEVVALEDLAPYTTTLTILDPLAAEVIRMPYNAESWTRSAPQTWRSRGIPGALVDRLDWESNPAATVAWRAILQMERAVDLEGRVLRPLEQLRARVNQATQEPPLVILTMGTHQYRGAIGNLEINRVRVNGAADGTTAEVSFTLTDNAK